MGNKQTANGSIFVKTDKPFYISGETVKGHIFINLVESFPGNQLFLKIKGKEESWWKKQQGKQTRHYSGKNTFYNHRIVLYSWNTATIPQGQYAFPFQFVLNSNLPGSYMEKSGQFKAIIMYKIKGEIVPINSNKTKKMKHTQELVIREPMKNIMMAQQGDMTVSPNTWCCIGQGQSYIKCYFESNFHQPGDNAKIITEIDNSNCTLNINSINVELIKHLRLQSSGGYDKIIQITIARAEFPGIAAGFRALGENRISTPIILQSQKSPIQPSTSGTLVRCEYSICVSAVMSGCTCCGTHPNVRVPITILSPPPINFGIIEQPSNWNPKEFEIKNVQFGQQDMYKSNKIPLQDNIIIDDAQQQQLLHQQQQQQQMNGQIDYNVYNPPPYQQNGQPQFQAQQPIYSQNQQQPMLQHMNSNDFYQNQQIQQQQQMVYPPYNQQQGMNQQQQYDPNSKNQDNFYSMQGIYSQNSQEQAELLQKQNSNNYEMSQEQQNKQPFFK